MDYDCFNNVPRSTEEDDEEYLTDKADGEYEERRKRNEHNEYNESRR